MNAQGPTDSRSLAHKNLLDNLTRTMAAGFKPAPNTDGELVHIELKDLRYVPSDNSHTVAPMPARGCLSANRRRLARSARLELNYRRSPRIANANWTDLLA
jgi:hypothetical protein